VTEAISPLLLSCSACRKSLAEVYVVDAGAVDPGTGKPFRWKLTASCPYCGDASWPLGVTGQFRRDGYSVQDPTDPLNCSYKTFIDEDLINGEEVRFVVKKA
jgi:hypothetical protein